MPEPDIIITGINGIKRDKITADKPYIPILPRPSHALAIITSGSIEYRVEGESSVARVGELLFIKSGFVDIASAHECEESEFVTFDFRTLDDGFELARIIRIGERYEEFLRLYEQLLSLWSSGAPRRRMKCVELIYGILNRLPENTPAEQSFAEKYPKIADAVAYLNRNYANPSLSARELAEVCRMSESNLNRLVRELYGETTSGLIRQTRIRNAQNLLLSASNRVSEIANAVGYSDVYSFSHAFRAVTGKSPSEWRHGGV